MTPRSVFLSMMRFRFAAVLLALQSLIPMGCCCGCVQTKGPAPSNPAALPIPQPNPGIAANPENAGLRPREKKGRRYALLVGVTQYGPDSPGLDDLSYPDEDVRALAEVLVKKGYREEDVIVLSSGTGKKNAQRLPTKECIWAELDRLVKNCGPDDVLLVALSGHGHQPPNGSAHFCPYRGNTGDLKSLVLIDQVAEKMAKAAGMNILLVDACRNGIGARDKKREYGEGFDVLKQPKAAGVLTYYSCSHGERSWEVDELRHGLFFDSLIRGLNGEADDRHEGEVGWTELVGFIERHMKKGCAKYGKVQTPHLTGDTTKYLPLAVFAAKPPVPPVTGEEKIEQPVQRTIPLDRELPSWNDELTIKLVSIELRNDGKMRWRFSFVNNSAKALILDNRANEAYVTDQNRERSSYEACSSGNTFGPGYPGINLPAGQKSQYWIDFEEPKKGAETLTAWVILQSAKGKPGEPLGNTPSKIVVRIVPGKAAITMGKIVLTHPAAIVAKVWVEVDGQYAKDWPKGSKQVTLDVLTGVHGVAVYSDLNQGKTTKVFEQRNIDVRTDEAVVIEVPTRK